MRIEFLYFEGCPHHRQAYKILLEVLKQEKAKAEIERIEIRDDEDAVQWKFIGSPTIRIDGVDVDRVTEDLSYAKTCRVYLVDEKISGLPTKAMIEKTLRASKASNLEDK